MVQLKLFNYFCLLIENFCSLNTIHKNLTTFSLIKQNKSKAAWEIDQTIFQV